MVRVRIHGIRCICVFSLQGNKVKYNRCFFFFLETVWEPELRAVTELTPSLVVPDQSPAAGRHRCVLRVTHRSLVPVVHPGPYSPMF